MEALQSIPQQNAIELTGLTKSYGGQMAVNRLNLVIPQGEIFGLLGPNGAGKTTTILMMLGLTEPSSGEVRVLGMDPRRQALQIKRRVGYMPDDIGFYEDLTALDNLMYTARLNGISESESKIRSKELLDKVGLSNAKNKKVGAFSRGMRQRLGLADVLIKRPDIIILDEPTLGIDPEGVRELLRLIHSLNKEEGLTVLLSSHHLHQVQQVCDRVGLFVEGRLIACGNIEELSRELDEELSIIVDLELASWDEGLQAELAQLDGVVSLDCRPSATPHYGQYEVTVTCSSDITTSISRIAAAQGGLYGVRRRRYGLDDIYHRCFEGGEPGGR